MSDGTDRRDFFRKSDIAVRLLSVLSDGRRIVGESGLLNPVNGIGLSAPRCNQVADKQSLFWLLIDTWQADAARDTRTLSGGESFLVSLALALALSDLVSVKTRIESLFLDEGFGTLDAETLDTALDALDALNASGKTIGVISHVEAMKERIPVQIRVRKINGLGYSKLELPRAQEA